jgi:hypothetical protein
MLTIALAGIPQVAHSAEPIPAPLTAPLDDAFADYLAEFEDQSDNWTWFADDAVAPAKTATPAQPAAKHPARTSTKNATEDSKQ